MTRAQLIRDRIVEEVDATGFGAHGLHVLAGDDTASHRWTADDREDVQSVAKGVSVLAAAFAVEDGVMSLDTTVGEFGFTDELGAGVGEVTLRRLLTMTSGIDLPWSPTLATDFPDLAREFLSRDSRGEVFQYSPASTYTAMTLLATRVGDVGAYLDERLFTPLGIDDASWSRCPHDRIAAAGGLWLRTEEMARIGRLIRDRGLWQGQQLVPASWIDAMHSDWVDTGSESASYARYALAGWGGPGAAWRLHGAGGQLLIFVGDTVVTIAADDHFAADGVAAFAVDVVEATVD